MIAVPSARPAKAATKCLRQRSPRTFPFTAFTLGWASRILGQCLANTVTKRAIPTATRTLRLPFWLV